MEFLDINLTKDSSLLLNAIHSHNQTLLIYKEIQSGALQSHL
jgi:hypothetical protein